MISLSLSLFFFFSLRLRPRRLNLLSNVTANKQLTNITCGFIGDTPPMKNDELLLASLYVYVIIFLQHFINKVSQGETLLVSQDGTMTRSKQSNIVADCFHILKLICIYSIRMTVNPSHDVTTAYNYRFPFTSVVCSYF